jgi:hypothetical protein
MLHRFNDLPVGGFMKFKISSMAVALMLVGGMSGQITQKIQAHISHSFLIGNTTLPPGNYTFLMEHDNENHMFVTNENDKKTISFNVRQAVDDHTPKHGELIFRKYGETEFLSKIFQSGETHGVELTESKSREARFAKEVKVIEHMEETK